MKKLVYFMIIASMIGSANVLSITVEGFQLSPFRMLVILTTILLIITKTKNGIAKYEKRENFYSLFFLGIWLCYSLITVIWVKDYTAWFKACFFIGTGFLVHIILSTYLATKEDILTAFKVMVPMIIIHNIIGWCEIITGNYIFLIEERISAYASLGWPVSTFFNTNDLMVFLFFSVFILYICLVNTDRKVYKVILTATLASTSVLILTSSSRATILGLLISGMIFVIFVKRRKYTKKNIIVIFAILLILVTFLHKEIIAIVQNVFNSVQLNFNDESSSEYIRKNLIMNGLNFLARTFGFGTGAGNIEYWMENYAQYNVSGIYNIHNWWLEILTGYGIGIFVLYLIFYYKLIKSMFHRIRQSISPEDISISLGILCILSGYVIVSVTSSTNINDEWLWTFWAVVVAYQGCNVMTKEN